MKFLLLLTFVAFTLLIPTEGKCFGNNWRWRDLECRGPRYDKRFSFSLTKTQKRNFCCEDAPNTSCWWDDSTARDAQCQGLREDLRYSYKLLMWTKYCCSDPLVMGPACFHNDWIARDEACKNSTEKYSVPVTPWFRDYPGAIGGTFYCCPPGSYWVEKD